MAQVGVRLPPSVFERLQEQADFEGLLVSELARRVIKDFVDELVQEDEQDLCGTCNVGLVPSTEGLLICPSCGTEYDAESNPEEEDQNPGDDNPEDDNPADPQPDDSEESEDDDSEDETPNPDEA